MASCTVLWREELSGPASAPNLGGTREATEISFASRLLSHKLKSAQYDWWG